MPRTLAGTGGAAAPAPPAVPVFDLQLLVLGEEDAGRFSRDPLSVEQLRPGKPGRFQHADHKASSVVPLASVVGAKHAEDHYQPLATQHFGLVGYVVVVKRLGRWLRLGRRIVGEDRLQPLARTDGYLRLRPDCHFVFRRTCNDIAQPPWQLLEFVLAERPIGERESDRLIAAR